MCGIAGVLTAGKVDGRLIRRIVAPLSHRGPDDSGIWLDQSAGIALGHRRLSIVDLSPAGHQPMESSTGRFIMTYNGEIYNHQDIRRELEQGEGLPEGGWRGHSDSEVLLQAIVTWGLRAALERCVGMFAIGLWDRQERELTLVRDRFGEKPLYYGWIGKDFVFASELKALQAHPEFRGVVDRKALGLYAARTYIPAPHTIFRDVYKLEPGCILSFGAVGNEPVIGRYWSYRDVVETGLSAPIIDEADALCELDRVLSRAVSEQAVADVPIGGFLSGGVDSSTVVALYQRHSAKPIRTFSLGFSEDTFDEAGHARAVARHLGTMHHEEIVTPQHAREVIPLMPTIYDEPFADSSQIPTFLVSQFARSQVTVALTGDGGDELFAGYNRHFLAPRLWNRLSRVPRPILRASSGFSRLPSFALERAAQLLPGWRKAHVGAKLQKALRIAGRANSLEDVYSALLDEWYGEPTPVLGAASSDPIELELVGLDSLRIMYCDAVTYLPDDILCKVDRASMAVGLETRVPFLDHRVAELAARIPINQKVRGGRGKHLLRELLYRHVPRKLIDRPKAGFAVPVGEWIKGPLRSWAEDLLDPGRMASEGYFDAAIVQRRWRDHLAGRRESAPSLWAILMFQAWYRAQG